MLTRDPKQTLSARQCTHYSHGGVQLLHPIAIRWDPESASAEQKKTKNKMCLKKKNVFKKKRKKVDGFFGKYVSFPSESEKVVGLNKHSRAGTKATQDQKYRIALDHFTNTPSH